MRIFLATLLVVALQSADLVGHWNLDDAAGLGNAKLVGGPKWVAGTLSFDGVDDHVAIPNSKELENLQEGSYTASAWFKPEDTPPGTEAENNAHYGIVMKAGWHSGLHYTNEKKFMMDHWLKTDGDEPKYAGAGTFDTTFEPGKLYHVVGVVDRAAGRVVIYVGGKLEGTGEEWDANAPAREYGQEPWRIGVASPTATEWGWAAKGVIDDVRLYKKALGAGEVEALFKAGTEKK